MQKIFSTLTVAVLIYIAASCQSKAGTQSGTVTGSQERCRLTEISTTLPSQKFTEKFFYDSLGKVSYMINNTGDTNRYYYSPSQIVIERPRSSIPMASPQTSQWKEIYGLDANGLAKYRLLRNESKVRDSTAFTYDAGGYLVRQKVYTENVPDVLEIAYSYTDGNLTKAIFNEKNDILDSIVFRYTDIDVPAYAIHYLFQDLFRSSTFHSWTGRQSKKLPGGVTYYIRPGGVMTIKYSYILGADGKPVASEAETHTALMQGKSYKVMTSIKYDCD